MKRQSTIALVAIAQAYAWFALHTISQHLFFGSQLGSQDMGLETVVPAWIWAILVSLCVGFILYYKTQRFPWSYLLFVGLGSIAISFGGEERKQFLEHRGTP